MPARLQAFGVCGNACIRVSDGECKVRFYRPWPPSDESPGYKTAPAEAGFSPIHRALARSPAIHRWTFAAVNRICIRHLA